MTDESSKAPNLADPYGEAEPSTARFAVDEVAELRIRDGFGAQRYYKVEQTVRIGRSAEAEITIDDPEVSRFHVRVVRKGLGTYGLEDLGSRNGTYLNGTRVQSAALRYGDRGSIGLRTFFEFDRFDMAAEEHRRRERFETVGRLGLGVAHDLNNLLTALVAGASYLEDLPTDRSMGDREVRECISDMVLAAGRASELTHSIMSFAKGRATPGTSVDLSELVNEVVRLLKRVIDKRIAIHVQVEPEVFVHGCRSELYQAILNLCLNARDAMSQRGGELLLAAAQATPQDAGQDWPADCPAAVLCVSDTGSGMDEKIRTRVFEPLFTTKERESSYGLGLATVHEIVCRHGGKITVESALGVGSRFCIFLPQLSIEARRQSGTREGAPLPVGAKLGRPIRMLIVDDEPIVRRSLARQLRGAGIDVTDASDTGQALANLEPGKFDLIVLDVDAPGARGASVPEAIWNTDPCVGIVLGTARTDLSKPGALPAVDGAEVMQKPYLLDALIDAAVRAIGHRARERSLRTRG